MTNNNWDDRHHYFDRTLRDDRPMPRPVKFEGEVRLSKFDEIKARADAATPGPWKVAEGCIDDEACMQMVLLESLAVDWKSAQDASPPTPNAVAATMVQYPRYVSPDDDKWDENAEFIAHARTDIPLLLRALELSQQYECQKHLKGNPSKTLEELVKRDIEYWLKKAQGTG